MNNNHGGKRSGAGRPRGSSAIPNELKEAFQEHTQTAIDGIVKVAGNPDHAQHLKACELILNRGYGAPKPAPEIEPIISAFLDGTISALKSALLIESLGLKVPKYIDKYASQEIKQHRDNQPFSIHAPPMPMPDSIELTRNQSS